VTAAQATLPYPPPSADNNNNNNDMAFEADEFSPTAMKNKKLLALMLLRWIKRADHTHRSGESERSAPDIGARSQLKSRRATAPAVVG